MNIAEKLVEYRNTRKGNIFGSVNSDSLVVIVTELLAWLKLERKREIWIEQGRKIKHKPLELNMNYPWCKDLSKILQEGDPLAEVFRIEGRFLDFKENITPEYIHEARLIAYEKYNPEMIVN